MSTIRVVGNVATLAAAERKLLLERTPSADESIRSRVAEIIARVRCDGDDALLALARELDGAELDSLEVPRDRWERALDELPPAVIGAMERARDNIETAHRAQLPRATDVETEPGVLIRRRPDPLGRVGVYAPGGRAAYPSSVLMCVVPARAAGVGEIVLCSPPGRTGVPSSVVLAAAALTGVDRVFAIGGAGAVAALAYGTATVSRVERIVGPGNAYVAEAKLQVAGRVGIDSPAGPSELLVIADDHADPEAVAREMLAQAEHDPMACVIAVVVGDATCARVAAALDRALEGGLSERSRGEIIREALATRGAVLSARSVEEAIAFGNEYAPEHLLLVTGEPERDVSRIRNAGTVFLGLSSSVPFGDYMTGANHVLPTGGLARTYSGLSVLDFVRWTTYQTVDPAAAARLAADVAVFADAEGLPAHAAAARAWGAAPGAQRDSALDGDEALGARRSAEQQALGVRRSALGPANPPSAERLTPAVRPSACFTRATYQAISLYDPDRAPCAVDLSDNTNLFGIPPHAEQALREAPVAALTRYPAVYATELKAALAEYIRVRPEEIVTGCGSDDILDSALRAVAEPGERVAFPWPSFAMIPLFTRMNGLEPVPVPLAADLDIDADALLATGARVVYLCSPNNPTGTLISPDGIEWLLARVPGVVILDEAYAEFAGECLATEAPRRGRLLVVRTMSKAFGLAGLRVGYAVGDSALVAEVEKSRGPYKVNAAAERAGVAALRSDLDWVRARVAEVRQARRRFADELSQLGLAPIPSAANFVLVPVRDATSLARRMRAAGVAVRPFSALPSVGDALRITIGPWPMMERALAALGEALRCE